MTTVISNDRSVIRRGIAVVVTAIAIATLGACSSNQAAETPSKGAVISDGLVDPDAFRADLVAAALPQDEATALIEQNGYTWRLGTIDGVPQAVTMDYRMDRLTLTVNGGIVTDAEWG